MKNYVCKPKRQDLVTKILCILLIVGSAVSFYLPTLFPAIKAIGQLVSVVLLLVFVQITTKFLLTEYRYALEEGNLYLSTRQGKREKNLGFLPLGEQTFLYNKETFQNAKPKHKISHKFSYCQNLFPKNPHYLMSPEEDGSFVLLVFEPDETLLSLLKEIIQK